MPCAHRQVLLRFQRGSGANGQFVLSLTRGGERPVGIGVMWGVNSDGALCVKTLLPGGPALESGLLEPGDELRKVGDVQVYRLTAKVF